MMIKKASGLIQMTNTLTRSQRTIYNYLLFVVKEALRSNPEQRRFEANISDIKKFTGAQNNSHIKESILKMQLSQVKYNVLGKDKAKHWSTFPLLLDIDASEDALVSFSISEELVDAISFPSIYGLIDLKVVKQLQSKYAVAIYEFVSDYLKIGKKRVNLDDFKTMMGIDPQRGYKRFSDFKSRVIDPSLKEINEKTSIALSVETIYRGRKASALEFRFIYKDEAKSQQKQFDKKEQFVRYRQEVYDKAEGRPIFVYQNKDVVVDKHPKKQKIMVGYKTPDGVEWYSDKEALVVWEILMQNKTAVDAKLWEYFCEDFAF